MGLPEHQLLKDRASLPLFNSSLFFLPVFSQPCRISLPLPVRLLQPTALPSPVLSCQQEAKEVSFCKEELAALFYIPTCSALPVCAYHPLLLPATKALLHHILYLVDSEVHCTNTRLIYHKCSSCKNLAKICILKNICIKFMLFIETMVKSQSYM